MVSMVHACNSYRALSRWDRMNGIDNRDDDLQARALSGADGLDVLERTTDAVLSFDRDWNLTLVNPVAARLTEQLTGRTVDQYLGRNFWSAFPELEGSPLEEQYRRAVREQEPVRFSYHFEPLDLWVDIRAFPGPDGLSVFYRDITDQVAQQEERERLEVRAHQILENATDVVALSARDGTLRYVNPAVRRSLGYAPAELHGRHFVELVHPDDLELVEREFQRLIREGPRDEAFEVRLRSTTGAYRLHQIYAAQLPDGRDGPGELLFNSRDITDERALQATLQREDWLFSALMEMVDTAAVVLLGLAGTVLSWNRGAEELTGYPSGKVVGGPWSRTLDASADEVTALLERAGTREAVRAELGQRREDGTRYTARVEVRAIREATGTLLGYCAVSTPV